MIHRLPKAKAIVWRYHCPVPLDWAYMIWPEE